MRLLSAVALAVGVHFLVSACLIQRAVRSKKRKADLKKKFPYPVTKIAHRGGSLLGPENTLYTFTRAVEEGFCDMIELDVRESKDGQVVVSHDSQLEITCGSPYAGVAVSDLVVGKDPSETLPQCKRIMELEFPTSDIMQYEASEDTPVDDTTRVCLLREVLDKFPSTPLHIDIKDASKDFVAVVLDLIAAYGRESITFVGSSELQNQQFINAYFAERGIEVQKRYRIFAGHLDFFRTYLYFYTGILPYLSLNYDVFSIPVFTRAMKVYAARKYGKVVAHIGGFLFSSPLLWRYLQSRGIAVVGWNFNSEVDILEAIQWPINGVMSDDPIKLHQVIEMNKGAIGLNVLTG
ncbi:hypothetical protein JKF63_03635 [Porcisia hertigi]|uniref:GP-PDE domain-containing protein n=1 Tax=Porcisia hertigi TaxID=2761500 RepID=A0A836L6C8_9TRYP|nr:hypothetical protein JKF63_03635 [Porcisia hertigi]